jgi:hypothetical protein
MVYAPFVATLTHRSYLLQLYVDQVYVERPYGRSMSMVEPRVSHPVLSTP